MASDYILRVPKKLGNCDCMHVAELTEGKQNRVAGSSASASQSWPPFPLHHENPQNKVHADLTFLGRATIPRGFPSPERGTASSAPVKFTAAGPAR